MQYFAVIFILEERLSRSQATSSKFLGLEWRATHKLNLTHRWSTGDCLVVNTQVLQYAGIKIKC